MALNISRVVVGSTWTLLNSTDAVLIQFQARGAGQIEITRGTSTAPVGDVPAFEADPKHGRDPVPIDDLILAPAGGRIWARSLTGGTVTCAWTDAL